MSACYTSIITEIVKCQREKNKIFKNKKVKQMLNLVAATTKKVSVYYMLDIFLFFLSFLSPNLGLQIIYKCVLYTNNYGKLYGKLYCTIDGGVHGVMIIVIGNGLDEPSSKPVQVCQTQEPTLHLKKTSL